MKNEDNKIFDYYKMDIINYISQYISVMEISKRYMVTKCYLTKNSKNKIKISKNNFLEANVLPRSGATIIPIVADNISFKIVYPICFVNNAIDNFELVRQTMFHELMHVGSTDQILLNNKKLLTKSGINFRIYDSNIKENCKEEYLFLNEALTELVTKFIYDKIFNEKYQIVISNEYEYTTSIYERSYFLLAFLLLNYFEKHPEILFEIYFNNNIELFKKILEENTDFTLEELKDLVNKLQKDINDIKLINRYKKIISKLNKKNPLKNKDVLYQYNL